MRKPRISGNAKSRAVVKERLVTARKNAGITQKEIAKHCGVSWQAVSQWESQKCEILPSLTNLLTMARLYMVPFQWIATGDYMPAEILRLYQLIETVRSLPHDDRLQLVGRIETMVRKAVSSKKRSSIP